ncbi:MAG TPA: SprT family zinc-dependent metalloprotease [Candidatus Limnocylindrales bacterium]|jgi:predicted metal-dependent hydrolase|nr:SprT family zinc-dependent metalloprotease [Candidatus Limnocylindrales bacterium]
MSAAARRPAPVVETKAVVRLAGGDLEYTLRRSPRARRLRVTIHPERGVVVSLPAAARRGWGRPDALVDRFLAEREDWIRRHLERQEATRARLEDRPDVDDGRLVPYLGEMHRIRVVAAPPGLRASRVSRVGAEDGDELVVERAPRDRRATGVLLEAWFRSRARALVDESIAVHAGALGVFPRSITIRDTTSRWGSCSRRGALSFSWRLVLAPPPALDAVVAHELCHLRVFGHTRAFWALLETRVPEHATWRRWLRTHAPELHAALD